MTPIEALQLAEETLGNNLVWIADQCDLKIRQNDPETLQRLQQLNEGWKAICQALKTFHA
jgi:hypothetical protein